MSTQGKRDYRPSCHYTPPTGWINDPNGLSYENGTWHLFAQHNPVATHFGPMHWRHATSTDLLHWQDQGIALRPDDKLGVIFSGSAVIDNGNTSGLGQGVDPMILMYTHHGDHEQQSIAWSLDRVHFTPYEGNPVIANTELKNFRDPKVFRDEARSRWTVVIAAGDRVVFYASEDLKSWRKTGEFGAAENKLGGVFECPDLFPLKAPDGTEVWVLFASMSLPLPAGGHRMQYFLGSFDGETFHETIPSPRARILDGGYDDYAAVTFSNADERLMLGWGDSWAYTMFEPTNEFCGLMTYARKLSLVETDTGLHLAACPVTPEFTFGEAAACEKVEPIPFHRYSKSEGALPGELFQIHVEATEGFALTLSNDDGEALNVTVTGDERLVVDRTKAGENGFSPAFASGVFSVSSAPRTMHGPITLDLYFDRMIAETFMDKGTVFNSTVVFPEKPYTRATLLGEGKMWIGKPVE